MTVLIAAAAALLSLTAAAAAADTPSMTDLTEACLTGSQKSVDAYARRAGFTADGKAGALSKTTTSGRIEVTSQADGCLISTDKIDGSFRQLIQDLANIKLKNKPRFEMMLEARDGVGEAGQRVWHTTLATDNLFFVVVHQPDEAGMSRYIVAVNRSDFAA